MSQDLNRLQYSISSWKQAVRCRSNNSKRLRISVASYLDSPILEGQSVSVVHPKYGVLFTALTTGQGRIISDNSESGQVLPFLTTSEILGQLAKFGFDITYEEEPNLPENQLSFLSKILSLGYDAITRVYIRTPKNTLPTIIAYNSSITVDYLPFNSEVSKIKFDADLERGSVINIGKMEPLFTWAWLTYTCQIQDILDDNNDESTDDDASDDTNDTDDSQDGSDSAVDNSDPSDTADAESDVADESDTSSNPYIVTADKFTPVDNGILSLESDDAITDTPQA